MNRGVGKSLIIEGGLMKLSDGKWVGNFEIGGASKKEEIKIVIRIQGWSNLN